MWDRSFSLSWFTAFLCKHFPPLSKLIGILQSFRLWLRGQTSALSMSQICMRAMLSGCSWNFSWFFFRFSPCVAYSSNLGNGKFVPACLPFFFSSHFVHVLDLYRRHPKLSRWVSECTTRSLLHDLGHVYPDWTLVRVQRFWQPYKNIRFSGLDF